jgi:D-3-phosphoglycerate dehydrogenase
MALMNIIILDDYQDVVRKLDCATMLEAYQAKVYTNTVKGQGQLAVRLKDADIVVLIHNRSIISKSLVDKLPKLKLISQTGQSGIHVDIAACTENGIAVAEGVSSYRAPAELTWALIMTSMRRLPQYIGNLKQGAWQQSGLKSVSMPPNFGLGRALHGRTLGILGYGNIGKIVAGFGKSFGMSVVIWGSEISRSTAVKDGLGLALSREAFFSQCDVISLHLKLCDATRFVVTASDLALMKPTSLLVNTSHSDII